MSSSLLLQLCPTYFVHLTWMVFEMGGKWLYSCCFVGFYFLDLFKTAWTILSLHFVSIYVVYPYRSIDTGTVWKNSHFILSDRSDFHMINNVLITVHTFTRHMLTSFSVDEMLLPMYMNLSNNFKGLTLKVEMAHFRSKHMNSVLLAFMCKAMPPAALLELILFHLFSFFFQSTTHRTHSEHKGQLNE